MLNNVLLHLDGATQAKSVIRLGVSVAQESKARVRGLTLLDTRRVEAAYRCESAVYAVMEQSRQTHAESQHGAVRFHLSRACLEAGLDFDIRRTAGNPLKVLPHEARFHDLTVTSALPKASRKPTDTDFSLRDLAALLQRGMQPMLVAHPDQRPITRVLMAYDGSDASGRAIRSFLGLDIFTEAEHRLLAIGGTEHAARSALREVADYCFSKRRSFEAGCACGTPRRVLRPYAKKWQADLLVLGVAPRNRVSSWFVGIPALNMYSKLRCSLYVAS